MNTNPAPVPRWSRDQIRAARKAPLAQLLRQRGLELYALEAGNFSLPKTHPGLLLKDSYWRWPERQLAGNTIDFLTQILAVPFHDAMRQICEAL